MNTRELNTDNYFYSTKTNPNPPHTRFHHYLTRQIITIYTMTLIHISEILDMLILKVAVGGNKRCESHQTDSS